MCIQGGLFKAFVIMFLLWLLFISLPGSFNLSCPCVKSGLIPRIEVLHPLKEIFPENVNESEMIGA